MLFPCARGPAWACLRSVSLCLSDASRGPLDVQLVAPIGAMSLLLWIAAAAGLAWLWRAARPRMLPAIPYTPFSTPLAHLPAMVRHVAGSAELSTFFEASMDQLGRPPLAQVALEPGGKPWLLVADVQEIADISSVGQSIMHASSPPQAKRSHQFDRGTSSVRFSC